MILLQQIQSNRPRPAAFGTDCNLFATQVGQAFDGFVAAIEDPDWFLVQTGERTQFGHRFFGRRSALNNCQRDAAVFGHQQLRVFDRAGGVTDFQFDAVASEDFTVLLGECEIGTRAASRGDDDFPRTGGADEPGGGDEGNKQCGEG